MSISFPIPNKCQDTDSPTHISGSGKFPKRYPLRAERQKHTGGGDPAAEPAGPQTAALPPSPTGKIRAHRWGECFQAAKLSSFHKTQSQTEVNTTGRCGRKALTKGDHQHTRSTAWELRHGHSDIRSTQSAAALPGWPSPSFPALPLHICLPHRPLAARTLLLPRIAVWT